MNKPFSCALLIAAASALYASAAEAKAVVVASSINRLPGYSQGRCVSGPAGICGQGNSYSFAQSFTPSMSGTLDHLDLALANSSGTPGPGLDITLVADSAGKPRNTGPVMEEWTLTKIVPAFSTTVKVTKITSKVHPAITGGVKYWIVAVPSGFAHSHVWMSSTLAGQPPALGSDDGGHTWPDTTSPGAFDVWIQ